MKGFPSYPITKSDRTCPYCCQLSDFAFPFPRRRYFHCPTCDLIYLGRSQQSTTEDMLSYYKEHYYNDYADDQSLRDRTHLSGHILDVIEGYYRKGRLLDVGCGCGFFLRAAKDRGWNVTGVDPSLQSIEKARDLVGSVAVSVGTVHDVVPTLPFDVVTMINVLDHLQNPWLSLVRVRELIRPGGLLYLRFPNGQLHASLARLQAAITSKAIINDFLVFHEYAFTPRFIRGLLMSQGFEKVLVSNAPISGAALYQKKPLLKFVSYGSKGILGLIASLLQVISGQNWFLWPSLEVTAFKKA